MATLSNSNSKSMYSWWWDSHISPKNSKWLQENLTDMDSKVEQMIKLIEEDADSFARRAEMYYKKRPELMKLVEEFYRAYRALAERYDHATGVIRHAHRTMAEVFPNQIPTVFIDESPAGCDKSEVGAQTPEMTPPVQAQIDPDELPCDALGSSSSHFLAIKRNGAFTEEPDSLSKRKGLKQLNDLFGSEGGTVRKRLNFHDGDEKGMNDNSNGNHDTKAQNLSESERVTKAEAEIVALKNALAKLEAEKESSLSQYQHNLDRLSNLESEISRAQEDSKELNERASIAEAEVHTLKEILSKLGYEKDVSLLQYQQCLQKIANLENSIPPFQKDAVEIHEQASKDEAEALKQTLGRLESEEEAALVQCRQCLETTSNLEKRLQNAEENVTGTIERAEKAENEVENLKQTISKLIEEKEGSALQYQQCLDTIADLKLRLFHAQEESLRLNHAIEDGVAKLKVAEEKCAVLERTNQTLHSDLDSSMQKMGNQSQELIEKQKELGGLWTCVQEERLRFLEAETAFQTLQHLHSQSQGEVRSLAAELQTTVHILKDMETRNSDLQEEIQRVKEENRGLKELNLSSAASIKGLQDDISSLREMTQKLEAEVEHRVDQRNALQQEIYCLKEELSESNKKHLAMKEQIELIGLDPDCFVSSVKELQDQNSKLKEAIEREKGAKMDLLEKLEIMEKLVEKNIVLENSMSDLDAELEAVRGKLKTVEETCQSLLEERSGLVAEKDTLISKIQIAAANCEKLSDKTKFLENSLFDANAELEGLRIKLKTLEDSLLLLDTVKSGLITEREGLVSQIDINLKTIEDLEKGHTELKTKVSTLENERGSSLQEIEKLGFSLNAMNQEYDSFVELSKAQIGDMELRIHRLQEENHCREKEYQKELDRGFNSQTEIFILQRSIQDLQEKSSSLMVEYQEIKEASNVKAKIISDLEHENQGRQVEIELLTSRIKILTMGLHQVLKRLGIDPDHGSENENAHDQKVLCNILSRLDEMENMLLEIQDENQHSAVENVVLVAFLWQLKSEAAEIALWETQAATFFGDLQISFVHEALLEAKIRELNECCESLEVRVASKDIEIDHLKGRVNSLEDENEGLKADMINFSQAVLLLNDSIESLENCIFSVRNSQDEVNKGTDWVTNLHLRIRIIEEAVIEKEKLAMQESSNENSKLETTMKQIEDIKSSTHRSKKKKEEDLMRRRETRDISEEEESEMVTKDIMPDQVSDCSSYSISRRETLEDDDQTLELWETSGQSSGIELKLKNPHRLAGAPTVDAVKGNKGKSLSEESLVIDKLEISNRFSGPNPKVNRKVLERLDSDLQKLANLRITIQDLKNKVEIIDKERKGKGDELDAIKCQLEEAEEEITKLFDVNRKLTTKVENRYVPSSDGKSVDLDETQRARRRRISQQARRGSEKIGRLQLEIQRIQFMLLKLDGERESRANKTRISETKTRVLLKDYVHGGTSRGQSSGQKRNAKKKNVFCACVQPQSP